MSHYRHRKEFSLIRWLILYYCEQSDRLQLPGAFVAPRVQSPEVDQVRSTCLADVQHMQLTALIDISVYPTLIRRVAFGESENAGLPHELWRQ